MKYLYKGMGMPGWGDVSGSVLLIWHEKVSDLHKLLRDGSDLCSFVVDGSCGYGMYSTGHDRPADCMTCPAKRDIFSHVRNPASLCLPSILSD
jgi:hypothetical protein